MSGIGTLSSLPAPLRTAIAPVLARIATSDRGAARERNDRTAASRTSHFGSWCKARGFQDLTFAYTGPAEAGAILAAYAQEIAEGNGIVGKQRPHVKTIQNYLRSAVAPAIAQGRHDPRFLRHATDRSGNRLYVPLLDRVFATAKKWTPPSRPERQPITLAMLHYLVTRVGGSSTAEFTSAAAIRDAVILASFTGSRVSEYAQTQASKGSPFNIVPCNAASGVEGGRPLAFIVSDFRFFTASQLELDWKDAAAAHYISVRFRYTKGVHSFTSRMFSHLPDSIFCPVQAAFRAVRRWRLLAPGEDTPVFCFLQAFFSRKPTFLADHHVTKALRIAAEKAHPDARHLVRQHINAISAHSLRVFACLCLQQAGWDEDTISYQLRWNSSAIKHYLRQSVVQVDAIGSSLLKDALVPASPNAKPVVKR